MCDDPSLLSCVAEGQRLSTTLTRIANALGEPISSFYAPEEGDEARTAFPDPVAARMLALVQTYLQRVGTGTRRQFVEAVQAMEEVEAR